MIIAGVALWLCGIRGVVGWVEGLILCGLFGVHTVLSVRNARKHRKKFLAESVEMVDELHPDFARLSLRKEILWLVAGGVGVSLSSYLMVGSSVAMARGLGVPELIISLTVVAFGTSLPELTTAITAVVKGHNDLSLGNVIGANILDLLLIPGLCGLVRTLPLRLSTVGFDMPVLLVLMILCIVFGFTRQRLERWEGGIILATYLVYVGMRWTLFN